MFKNYKIFFLNTPEFPMENTFKLEMDKFIKGFKYNGCSIYEVQNLENLFKKIKDDKNNIFFVGNQFIDHNPRYPNYKKNLDLLSKNFPESWFICWFFQKIIERNQFPFKKYILTSEKFFTDFDKILLPHQNMIKTYNNFIHDEKWKYIPLVFGVDINPLLPQLPLQDFSKTEYESCFIGTKYKKQWTKDLNKCMYYTHHEHNMRFCPILEKINYLKHSVVALGFNANDNITNAVVTDRIYEGLAYCSVVLTDNPGAVKATNNIAVLVKNKQELKEKIKYYMEHKEEREEKNKLGKEFLKIKGTFYHSALNFLKVIHEHN
jgi:spore maturation protein CgeB